LHPLSIFGERSFEEDSPLVNVKDVGEVYVCPVCGNTVVVREAGGGELVCHGEPMVRKG
jgi:desulfoferrodoxin-like iron-binding protein